MKNKIIIPADKIHKFEKVRFYEIGNELIYKSQYTNKKLVDKFWITQLKKGLINWIFFNKKKGTVSLTLDVSLEDLEKFVKKAKQTRQEFRKEFKGTKAFRIFFKNLNSEITFMFKY